MKMYTLTGAKTYSTMSAVFRQGVLYSADQVGSMVDMKSIRGLPLFTEVEDHVETQEEIQAEVGLAEEAIPVEEVPVVEDPVMTDESGPEPLEVVSDEEAEQPKKKVAFGRKAKDGAVIV